MAYRPFQKVINISAILTFSNNRKYRVYARGYVGVALAHLTLWEKISKIERDIFVNIFEDDEVIKENYEENIMKELSKINGPFDFFNLSVIRPMGFEAHPGILKINDKNIGSKELRQPVVLHLLLLTNIGALLTQSGLLQFAHKVHE